MISPILSLGTLLALAGGPALAHEPLFMMSHQAPGKGAFDIHAGLAGARGQEVNQTSLETAFTLGLTRDLAVQVHLPGLVVDQPLLDRSRTTQVGLDDGALKVKWRLWDADQIGRKLAAAVMLESTLPLHGGAPLLTTGLAQGMESLHWYYFVDARSRFQASNPGDGPGTRFFADIAGGWRPYLHGLDDTDVVLFLETNFEHRLPDQSGGLALADSGGDLLFLSPEILASPSNRVMFKTGIQFPLLQFPNGDQAAEPTRFVVESEIRF